MMARGSRAMVAACCRSPSLAFPARSARARGAAFVLRPCPCGSGQVAACTGGRAYQTFNVPGFSLLWFSAYQGKEG
jgi:hypothetical protein